MCGRFAQFYTWAEVHDVLGVVGAPKNLRPHYNIAPTTPVDVVVDRGEGREILSARWGLVPAWWTKGLKDLPSTFNARAETVAAKPMFRDAFRKRRCVVPASGFFEWTDAAGGRQPHYFSAADGSIMAFAGLWDRWSDPATGEAILSCTVIVSGADAWMARYHDRRPVMLAGADVQAWLEGVTGPEAIERASPIPLRAWPVSRRVNTPGHDDPTLIGPVDPAGDPPAESPT